MQQNYPEDNNHIQPAIHLSHEENAPQQLITGNFKVLKIVYLFEWGFICFSVILRCPFFIGGSIMVPIFNWREEVGIPHKIPHSCAKII